MSRCLPMPSASPLSCFYQSIFSDFCPCPAAAWGRGRLACRRHDLFFEVCWPCWPCWPCCVSRACLGTWRLCIRFVPLPHPAWRHQHVMFGVCFRGYSFTTKKALQNDKKKQSALCLMDLYGQILKLFVCVCECGFYYVCPFNFFLFSCLFLMLCQRGSWLHWAVLRLSKCTAKDNNNNNCNLFIFSGYFIKPTAPPPYGTLAAVQELFEHAHTWH